MYKKKYTSNKSLKDLNTFKIDVKAKKIIFIKTIASLMHILQDCKEFHIPYIILGEGSNVLFLKNYTGIIIVNRIKGITIQEKKNAWLLHVYSGEKWHDLVKYTLTLNILGLENLALIPGCIGSAAIQNIGAYGLEFKNVCQYVDIISLKNNVDQNKTRIRRIYSNSCKFSYRSSIFKNPYHAESVIVAVGIKILKNWHPIIFSSLKNYTEIEKITARKIFNIVCKIRIKKLPNPKTIGNAGSFFKNPIITQQHAQKLISLYNLPNYPQLNGLVKISGGWLIENCKYKNIQIGDAAIHNKNKLILINIKNATSQEILKLARVIHTNVLKKFHIWLEPEIDFIGSKKKIKASKIFI